MALDTFRKMPHSLVLGWMLGALSHPEVREAGVDVEDEGSAFREDGVEGRRWVLCRRVEDDVASDVEIDKRRRRRGVGGAEEGRGRKGTRWRRGLPSPRLDDWSGGRQEHRED